MDKFIEQISCCGTKTSTPCHIFNISSFVEKNKQFINEVYFVLNEYINILLCHPLKSALMGVHAPTPKQHATAEVGA